MIIYYPIRDEENHISIGNNTKDEAKKIDKINDDLIEEKLDIKEENKECIEVE